VAEWLNAPDCKSVGGALGSKADRSSRRFESYRLRTRIPTRAIHGQSRQYPCTPQAQSAVLDADKGGYESASVLSAEGRLAPSRTHPLIRGITRGRRKPPLLFKKHIRYILSNLKIESGNIISMLSLSDAAKSGRLQEFIAEQESSGVGPIDRRQFENYSQELSKRQQ
jgi:hypothetical protein